MPYGLALYLGGVQFLFALCWTVYVVYLPGLLDAAGLPKRWVLWVLLLDQVVFALSDLAIGLAADRVRSALRSIGPMLVAMTVLSCAAFALLPFGASAGAVGPVVLFALIGIWTVTSSALRAPPWLLFARFAAQPQLPWLAAINLCGLAVASALSPYLALYLRAQDPRLPFVLASVALALTAIGLIKAERIGEASAAQPQESGRSQLPREPASNAVLAIAFASAVLLGLGFQAHVFFNAGALYLKFASAGELERLLPLFWVGFSFAMFPGAALTTRFGLWPVLAGAAGLAAFASACAAMAESLPSVIAAQVIAGGGWGCVLMALCTAALRLGFSRRQGLALGVVWSALSVAALARFGLGVAGLPQAPGFAQLAMWAPPVFWTLGTVAVLVLMRRAGRA